MYSCCRIKYQVVDKKIHESRPIGVTPSPKVNLMNFNHGRDHGRGQVEDHGKSRNYYYFRGSHSNSPNFKRIT